MNHKKLFPYLILIIAPLFSANREPGVKEIENNALASFMFRRPAANEKYVVDKKESVVTWKCSMQLTPNQFHKGYVDISKGELTIDKGQIVGGGVEVDMKTIADEHHRSDNNLIEHLKSPDFFDVDKFPIAGFAITKLTSAEGGNIEVTGNLTIKGITHEVTFPARIDVKPGVVATNAKVTIDRTEWDVRYRSGKFFDDLADKAISDSIEFEIKLVAKKYI